MAEFENRESFALNLETLADKYRRGEIVFMTVQSEQRANPNDNITILECDISDMNYPLRAIHNCSKHIESIAAAVGVKGSKWGRP